MNSTINPGLDVLNVGHGHLEIRFNQHDPAETDRAKHIISDMLQKGFAIFVDLGSEKGLHRVTAFDPVENAYIIKDSPDIPADSVAAPAPKGKATRKVPVSKVRATAVGRSAGG